MQLPASDRRYARITFAGFTASVSLVASVDNFATSQAVVIGPDGIGRVLVRGPSYTTIDGLPSLAVPAAGATLKVRATDSPELVTEIVGEIDIV